MLKTNDFFVEVCSEVVFEGDAQQYERDCALDAAQQAVADVDLFAAARTDAYFAAKRVLANEAARMRDLQVIVARVLKKAATHPATSLATATGGATSGQTSGAQHTSTGGSDSDDCDPDPADQIIPDPADQIIPDPAKNDPRILAHGDNPTARSIRKAILAIRQGIQHPAADYYVQRALAEMVKQVKRHVRCMPYRIPADIAAPLILDAALSLLYGLAGKHDFQRIPNPNFYNIVKRNIQVPANLREVANRLIGAESKKLDMLDVEVGLARAEGADQAITRLQPTLDEAGEVAVDAVDSLQSLDIQDDPLLTTWVRELADAGQRPDFEDDQDGAISAALAAMGAAGAAAFDSVRDVLKRVAGLSDADCRARARAIFAAMDFLDGCDTVQHRVEKLQTVSRNARGSFPPDMQRAAVNLLEGAGYPA